MSSRKERAWCPGPLGSARPGPAPAGLGVAVTRTRAAPRRWCFSRAEKPSSGWEARLPLGAGYRQTEPGAVRERRGAGRWWEPLSPPARPRRVCSGRGKPSCERGRRLPARPSAGAAWSRAQTQLRSRAGGRGRQAGRRGALGRAEANGCRRLPAQRHLAAARWQGREAGAVGEGGWVAAEEEEESGGGDQPAPAQPSALPRPDTAPGAEMADEPQKKPHLSALVGHTNGLTKPASLAAATRAGGGGGGGGGATASSKKLVIKNFRGGCGADRALSPGRCALPRRPALSRPLFTAGPAAPRPFPAVGSQRRGRAGPATGGPRRCHPPRRLIWTRGGCRRADNPPRCRHLSRFKGLRGHAWGSVRGGSGRSGAATTCAP